MLRRLFTNTAFSAAAFVGASAIGILLVPLLLHSYGVARFGLITLARIFLPSGVFAVLDFGVSEVVTQVVARARAGASWERAARHLTLLTCITLGVGGFVSLGLLVASLWLSDWLRISPEDSPAFVAVIRCTAIANLVLVPALVFDGVLKGFERFGALRATELGSNLVYAGLAVAAVSMSLGFEAVAYAFLIGVILRTVVLGFAAISLIRQSGLRPRMWERVDRSEVFERCRLMFQGKLVGIAQGQVPPLAVAATVGPAGVGIYDLLVRIPRFSKAILSVLNTALMPVAARAEELSDLASQRRLGTVGALVIPAVVVPPLAAAAAFSEPLLRIWVGETFAAYWPWHAAMFVIPLSNAVISFGSAALLVRTQATRSLLRLSTLQVVLQYTVSFALLHLFGERAFVLGQVVSMPLMVYWQLRIIASHQGINAQTRRQLWSILAIGALMVAVTLATPLTKLANPFVLAVAGALWCAIGWLIIGLGVVTAGQREVIFTRLRLWRR